MVVGVYPFPYYPLSFCKKGGFNPFPPYKFFNSVFTVFPLFMGLKTFALFLFFV